ncbi:MAG: BrnT family toxin [Nitrospinae bacterium]|nr:BrnT family toxin [Nitrospinota bacterium]MBF0633333.1 BrnT family toxin [Nitrospinota bacterium]
MKIERLIWIEEIVEKLRWKHRVDQDEVRETLANRPRFRFVEKGHRDGENIYSALGRTYEGRRLIIFFVYKKEGEALILSARDMTESERKRYEKK